MFDGTSLSKKKKEKNSQYERLWSGSNSTLKLLVCRNTSILSNFPYHPFFTIAKKYPQPSAEETGNLANLHNCQKFQSVFACNLTYFLVENGENNSRLISRRRRPRKLEMEFFCGSAITNAAAAHSDRFVCITHSLRRVIFGQPVPQSRRGSRCGGRWGGGAWG